MGGSRAVLRKVDPTRAPRVSWKKRVRALFGASLDRPLRAPFAREMAETNRRRASVLLPVMALAHLAHVALFHTSGAARAALVPRVLRWRDDVALTHAITFGAAVLLFAATRARESRVARL